MKTIGLLGGMSWPSTIDYYRILNELAQERFGGHHSADLILRSIDYHEIKSRYHEGWDEIPALLHAELVRLARLGPACIVLCNNTLHKALDALGATLGLGVPVIHIVRETGERARAAGMRKVLLLGTSSPWKTVTTPGSWSGSVSTLDAAVLACTELPLAVEPSTAPMPILNPTRIQCEAAFQFAM